MLVDVEGLLLVGYENQPLSETLPGFQFVSPRFLVFAGQCLFSILSLLLVSDRVFTLGWGEFPLKRGRVKGDLR